MQLSKKTIDILRNFADINSSIIIPAGNTIITRPLANNIRAKYEAPEEFPCDIAIYDLYDFLSGLTTFDNPEFDFKADHVVVSQKTPGSNAVRRLKYNYSDASLIPPPPSKWYSIRNPLLEFTLAEADVKTILHVAGNYKLPDVSISPAEDSVDMVVHNSADSSSPRYSVALSDLKTSDDFSINLKVDTLKILKDNYTVKVEMSPVPIIEFSSTSDLNYLIALDRTSYYNKSE